MKVAGTVAKAIGIAAIVLVGAAALVVAVPSLRAQVQHEPFVDIRTAVMGGLEIGVRMRDVTADDVAREKLSAVAGAVITEVRPNTPASTAGLQVGDVVTAFDGEKVRSSRHLARLIEETPEGREVPVEVMRKGSSMAFRVSPRAPERFKFGEFTALNRLQDRFPFERFEYQVPGDVFVWNDFARGGRLGAQVQDLSGQLGEYFGTSAGALVTSVDDKSSAKTAGLKAGDVITAINGQPVRTSADVRRRLASVDGKATLTIVRDRKEMTLDVTVTRDPITGRRGIVK
jgi:serine protease Do